MGNFDFVCLQTLITFSSLFCTKKSHSFRLFSIATLKIICAYSAGVFRFLFPLAFRRFVMKVEEEVRTYEAFAG